eukprot:jgi/Hompol1/6726/HPOL_005059-RA
MLANAVLLFAATAAAVFAAPLEIMIHGMPVEVNPGQPAKSVPAQKQINHGQLADNSNVIASFN